VILSFSHKGLRRFYFSGDFSGIQAIHAKKLRLILARLESIAKPEDMYLPGFDFHKLSGQLKDHYAVAVNKNWRVTFKFDGCDAYEVNYLDYH
jgi:toxin HigB-1